MSEAPMKHESGTVVRVRQVGQSGYVFKHPCFARVVRPEGSHGQVEIQIIEMDRRDYDEMKVGYELDNRQSMHGFTAPYQHLERGRDDGAAAVARCALMGVSFFVKEDNNG